MKQEFETTVTIVMLTRLKRVKPTAVTCKITLSHNGHLMEFDDDGMSAQD